MNLHDGMAPNLIGWVAIVLWAGCLWLALKGAPWHALRSNKLEPVWVCAAGIVAMLWVMGAGVHPGLELHLLGVTALTLMFGWQLALVGASLALIGLSALGLYSWAAVGMNGMLLTVLPVALSHGLGRIAYTLLPRHFFIYVLVLAFFGSMLVIGATITASAILLLALGAYPPAIIVHDYLVMLPLIMFPEGFITGMIMTMLVVYKPHWVRTFDDRDYIHGK
jgi:uncharacterized membrane protein